jgi:hypothetical protein
MLIFIVDWSNCLRRKLPRVGPAESFFEARRISPLRCDPLQVSATFGRRTTKIERELRLRPAVTSSATSSPGIAWAAYRENSREDG